MTASELPWCPAADGFEYRYDVNREAKYAWQARCAMYPDRIGEGRDPAQAAGCAAAGLVIRDVEGGTLHAAAEAEIARLRGGILRAADMLREYAEHCYGPPYIYAHSEQQHATALREAEDMAALAVVGGSNGQ
jgi:hypothetical protein